MMPSVVRVGRGMAAKRLSQPLRLVIAGVR